MLAQKDNWAYPVPREIQAYGESQGVQEKQASVEQQATRDRPALGVHWELAERKEPGDPQVTRAPRATKDGEASPDRTEAWGHVVSEVKWDWME